MNTEIKSIIKLLAGRYKHDIDYDKNVIILKSAFNKIKVWQENKYGFKVSFRSSRNLEKILEINSEDIFDVLIELFINEKEEKSLIEKTGILLIIDDWIKEEGSPAREDLEELKKDLKNNTIDHRVLCGNRYKAEYFKGILILTDDLCWSKSNVIYL